MIPDQWYAILESRSLDGKRPVGLVRMGERIVLWRDDQGRVVCLEDRCPHRGIALSVGRVQNGRLACAYHGMEFDAEGKCVHMPCAGSGAKIPGSMRARQFVTEEKYGLVWLWWGEERASYPPIPWIDEVPEDPRLGVTRAEIWPFNYVRCVENHLDVHHWAFVHQTIMVGVGEYFHEFDCQVEDDGQYIKTKGTLCRTNRHGKRPNRGWQFKAYCRLPSLNMIQVTPRFKSIVLQTPIDDETTWVVVRSFQTYAQFEPARWLLNQYCIRFLFSVPLHRQDFPLFHAQRPRLSGVGVNKLVAADAGIAKYLIARERLIKEAMRRREAKAQSAEDAGNVGPWDFARRPEGQASRLPVLAPRATMVSPRARNLGLGNEGPWGRALAWTLACLSFPLLVPSLVGARLLAWWDGR